MTERPPLMVTTLNLKINRNIYRAIERLANWLIAKKKFEACSRYSQDYHQLLVNMYLIVEGIQVVNHI